MTCTCPGDCREGTNLRPGARLLGGLIMMLIGSYWLWAVLQ